MLNQQGLRRIPAVERQNNPGLKYSRTERALLTRMLLSKAADIPLEEPTLADNKNTTKESGVQKPGLMTLPVEIRQRILEYLLIAPDGNVRPSRFGNVRLSWYGNLAISPRGVSHPLSQFPYKTLTILGNLRPTDARLGLRIDLCPLILATCSQIYREGWSLLYHHNTFEFWSAADARRFLTPGFRLRAEEVRHLALRCDYDNLAAFNGEPGEMIRSFSSKEAAEIICSFLRLDTVEIQFDPFLLDSRMRGQDPRAVVDARYEKIQESERLGTSKRDAVQRKPNLHHLRLVWIVDCGTIQTSSAPLYEAVLWKRIAARLISLEEPLRALGLM